MLGGTLGTLLWAAGPDLAVLVTPPLGAATDVHRVPWGASELPPATATLTHQPGATVRATVVREGTIAAIATASPRRDRSYDSTLFMIDEDAVYAACDDVVYASRPHVADGRVFVVRGWAGPTDDGALVRVDELALEVYRPELGTTAVVHLYTGFLLHIAGDYAGELIVYRVHPTDSDLVAIDPDSGDTRVLVPDVPPFARDFSVDPTSGRLTYVNRDQGWAVVQTDLETGATRTAFSSEDLRLVPRAIPGRGVVFRDPAQGTRWLDGPRLPGPEGIEHLRIAAGPYAAGLRFTGRGTPEPFVIDLDTGLRSPLPGTGAWVDLAGFWDGGAW